MKLFARFGAALGAALFLVGTAFAQTPPPAPAMSPKPPVVSRVKGYTKTLKNGKVVAVKGYSRKTAPMASKMTAIQGYNRTTKTGKVVAVKGYTRKAPMGAKKK